MYIQKVMLHNHTFLQYNNNNVVRTIKFKLIFLLFKEYAATISL